MLLQHRRRRDEFSISVTPLIDVILVLLIFFVASSHFSRDTQMKVALPQATGEASLEAPPDTLEISVDGRGNVFVNTRPLANAEVHTIKAALDDVAKGDHERPLIISADAKAPYQAVATAMDAAGQSGFHKLTMAAQAPSEP